MVDKSKNPGFKIGQVVYILSNKGQSIIPAMIVEQMTVDTLSGRRVSWKLAMGARNNPNKPQKIADSADINGEIYATLDDVKAVLEAKLKQFITHITSQAKKRTELWYGDQLKKVTKKSESGGKAENGKIDPEDILDDLVDGPATSIVEQGIAHVSSPSQDQSNLSEDVQKANLQSRLKDLATVTDEDMDADDVAEQEQQGSTPMGFIQGPDGTKIPVNLKVS